MKRRSLAFLFFFFFDVALAEAKDNVAEMPARVFIPGLGTLYF